MHEKLKTKNYIIICDESNKQGSHYSYFFGGAIIEEKNYELITSILNSEKQKLALHEMKRIKITPKNYNDYKTILKIFFIFIKSGIIKVRIMFSPNDQLIRLPKSEDESYSKLYYTFIKNAFSLFYVNFDIKLRLIFDELPETKEKCNKFKAYLIKNLKLSNKLNNKIFIGRKFIEEVNSEKHPVLQCIDVIMGVIENHLNPKPSSKRNEAKEKVFQFVFEQIQNIHESFCLTETTPPIYSQKGFHDQYKHFVYKKKTPDLSTKLPCERIAIR